VAIITPAAVFILQQGSKRVTIQTKSGDENFSAPFSLPFSEFLD